MSEREDNKKIDANKNPTPQNQSGSVLRVENSKIKWLKEQLRKIGQK